jgi:DNA-binding NtrC family response regulator
MSLPFTILVIDDEPVMRDSCFQVLSRKGCEVWLSESGRKGLKQLAEHHFDVVILDLKMPDINGFDILKTIHVKNPDTIVIVITGYPTVESAVEVMKMGAYDFLPKPFTPNMLRTVVSRALEKRNLYNQPLSFSRESEVPIGVDAIVGTSPTIMDLKQFIKKVSISDCSVLITGETGTGKELVARALHHHSYRRNNNFVTVDAGGLVDTLIESELFGHVKGSFTGAISDRVGRFEIAHRGTLFFDEISNMSSHIQSKLLRVLQEQEISRVGAVQLIPIDVRIIAATNTDLTHEVTEGNFREDLYYRLNVIPMYLPPLRERREDIPVLAGYFLKRFRAGKAVPLPEKISEKALRTMVEYDWPGNIRELEHMIKRTVALSDESEVDPFEITNAVVSRTPRISHNEKDIHQLGEVEKEHIEKMLKKFNYNKSRTAEILGIDRKTLRNKIRKYGIFDTELFET